MSVSIPNVLTESQIARLRVTQEFYDGMLKLKQDPTEEVSNAKVNKYEPYFQYNKENKTLYTVVPSSYLPRRLRDPNTNKALGVRQTKPRKLLLLDPKKKTDTLIKLWGSLSKCSYSGIAKMYDLVRQQYLGVTRKDIQEL